jgi:hypothetical protein
MQWLLIALLAAVCCAAPNGTVSIISATNPNLVARHCSFQLFACVGQRDPEEDFSFTIVPALNQQSNAFSFQSMNYPDHYISIISDPQVEAGRLGIDTPADANDASFEIVAGLSDPSLYSLRSLSKGSFAGHYATLNHKLQGVCAGSYQSPSSDIVLIANPTAADATWNLFRPPPPPPQSHTLVVHADQVSHAVDKMYMGCHR